MEKNEKIDTGSPTPRCGKLHRGDDKNRGNDKMSGDDKTREGMTASSASLFHLN